MQRPRPIFQPLLAVLLALAVLASPVLSAEACAFACSAAHDDGSAAATAEKTCCSAKRAEHRSVNTEKSTKSDTDDDCGRCHATCCRPVTTIEVAHPPMPGELPALSVDPAPAAAREFVAHDLIFHPPRA